ncbi:membrane-associated tyrosine- and threonine-specific cdc2-inhibitory kinase [Nematocida minor]|uniref:membrane-associated tyrosine- and threonine-specific cdc2-inhibitory kinase n=1 Tax=Nematocida minor TaxID=1912983 RepID=UPI00221E708F|nr:membrane-associated tyrosine- and threonine-specific cdc2-inhibitory kinase [Nematocida minor]KAI5189855.1 membrane-associated tyrosine- and threonine-specific cdc2-inhibitory kinase [Nematocida minor]
MGGETEEKRHAAKDASDKDSNNEECENSLVTPKTPEKKNPIKHISNIETPFKLNIKRNEIKEKDLDNECVVFSQAQYVQDMEEEGAWFRKKRIGRKEKPFSAETLEATRVIKAKKVCPVKGFFLSHFTIKSTLYISNESDVHLVEEKGTVGMMGQDDFCPHCAKTDLQKTDDEKAETVIKISKRKWATKKERSKEVKEAKFLYRLRNQKYIVKIIRAWEERAVLYMEMAFCNLGTLKEYMKKNVCTVGTKESLVLQIIKGIKAVHKSKIIHLDIKPENIYLHMDTAGHMVAKIGDFGISRSAQDETEIEFDGDRLYMAPELLQNKCSYASDIYSTGLVLIELLFDVGAPLKTISWSRIPKKEKKAIVQKSGISLHMYNLIKQMIDENPAKRPSAADLVESLKVAYRKERQPACGDSRLSGN